MKRTDRVAVCSRSFSKHPTLRAELSSIYERVTFNDQGVPLRGDALVEFLLGHDKAITALEKLDASILGRLPELKVVSKYGVGLDMIDLEAMRTMGKRLGWTGGVNRRAVAELALAFALNLIRKIPESNNVLRKGEWRQVVGNQLSNRTVGIVGCGFVGRELVGLLAPFNCHLLINDVEPIDDYCASVGAESLPLDKLLPRSDVVSLHVPLDESTSGLISARRIALMKKGAILINTARGGLVDEAALERALISGEIGGAGFDVFSQEPPLHLPLLNAPNFFGTPHIGGSSAEAVLAMGRAAIHGLEANEVP